MSEKEQCKRMRKADLLSQERRGPREAGAARRQRQSFVSSGSLLPRWDRQESAAVGKAAPQGQAAAYPKAGRMTPRPYHPKTSTPNNPARGRGPSLLNAAPRGKRSFDRSTATHSGPWMLCRLLWAQITLPSPEFRAFKGGV